MTRYELDPDQSQVWIEGTSSVHPIHATATGLTGWVDVTTRSGRLTAKPAFAGEVRVAVDRLQSGNPLVDRETRRRIDAKRHPEIVGTVVEASREVEDRVAVAGDIAFRGEVSRVEGSVTVIVDGPEVVLEGSQRLDVRDWGLQPPKVALLRVHPEIDVRIRLVGLRNDG